MTGDTSRAEALLAQERWNTERKALRRILLDRGLDQKVKWNKLCFCLGGRNVAIIYGMRDYCAIGFFKGALLDDEDGDLVSPGRHSQAMRQIRFGSLQEIRAREASVIRLAEQAIAAERAGREISFDETDSLSYPQELSAALERDPELASAFDALTPGRRRGYVIHVANARRPQTRHARINKCRPKILRGQGLNERPSR